MTGAESEGVSLAQWFDANERELPRPPSRHDLNLCLELARQDTPYVGGTVFTLKLPPVFSSRSRRVVPRRVLESGACDVPCNAAYPLA
jgi:hypothetical protein